MRAIIEARSQRKRPQRPGEATGAVYGQCRTEAARIGNPRLSATVQLRDWDSGKALWPVTSAGSLAAAFADAMTVPHSPGAAWSDPEVREQRRKEGEREQQHIGEFYQEQMAAQEDRLNREERARFQQQQRRG